MWLSVLNVCCSYVIVRGIKTKNSSGFARGIEADPEITLGFEQESGVPTIAVIFPNAPNRDHAVLFEGYYGDEKLMEITCETQGGPPKNGRKYIVEVISEPSGINPANSEERKSFKKREDMIEQFETIIQALSMFDHDRKFRGIVASFENRTCPRGHFHMDCASFGYYLNKNFETDGGFSFHLGEGCEEGYGTRFEFFKGFSEYGGRKVHPSFVTSPQVTITYSLSKIEEIFSGGYIEGRSDLVSYNSAMRSAILKDSVHFGTELYSLVCTYVLCNNLPEDEFKGFLILFAQDILMTLYGARESGVYYSFLESSETYPQNRVELREAVKDALEANADYMKLNKTGKHFELLKNLNDNGIVLYQDENGNGYMKDIYGLLPKTPLLEIYDERHWGVTIPPTAWSGFEEAVTELFNEVAEFYATLDNYEGAWDDTVFDFKIFGKETTIGNYFYRVFDLQCYMGHATNFQDIPPHYKYATGEEGIHVEMLWSELAGMGSSDSTIVRQKGHDEKLRPSFEYRNLASGSRLEVIQIVSGNGDDEDWLQVPE